MQDLAPRNRFVSNSPFQVIRSEITKLMTLRSILVTIGITVACVATLGYVYGRSTRSLIDAGDPAVAGFNSASAGLNAISYGQIGIIVLGVLVATSEYAGGQIRVSLAAVPNRNLFLTAKATALLLASLAVAVPTVVLSYLATVMGLGEHGRITLTTGDIPGHLAGAVGYLVLMSLLAFALGVLTRSTVVPLVGLIALTQAVSTVLVQTVDPLAHLARYLPDLAGKLLYAQSPSQDILTATTGGLVMVAWVAGLLLAGHLVLNRSDA